MKHGARQRLPHSGALSGKFLSVAPSVLRIEPPKPRISAGFPVIVSMSLHPGTLVSVLLVIP